MTADGPRNWGGVLRLFFGVYAVALFVATHWPKLKIEGVGRPDLVIHVAAFGLWTALCIGARLFGPVVSVRNIASAGGVAIAYAAIDEALQAIPWIHRTAAFDDWLADVGGIALACGVAFLIRAMRRTADRRSTVPSPPP